MTLLKPRTLNCQLDENIYTCVFVTEKKFLIFWIFSAVTWLDYCRHGVKQKTFNQFIDLFVFSLAVGDRGVCSQPKVVGRCRAAFPRYWFNSQTNRCERFTYGGCGGNENNFKTSQECQRRCQWKLCKLFIIAITNIQSIYDADAFDNSMFYELMNGQRYFLWSNEMIFCRLEYAAS